MTRRLVIAITLVLGLGSLSGCSLSADSPRVVTVMLADSAGLFEGNDVGVLGVAIGSISRIEPKGSLVEVTLNVTDRRVAIPANVGAAVIARSVATDRYVELTPAYTSGPQLASGAIIPVEKTATPVDFDEVLNSVETFSSGLMSTTTSRNSLKTILGVTAKSLDGNGEKFKAAIESLNGAVGVVSDGSDRVFGTMQSLDILTQGLVTNEKTLRKFLSNITAASEILADERLNLGAALRSLSRTADEFATFTRDNRDSIKQNVNSTTTVIENVVESRNALEEALDTLPLAMDNIKRAQTPRGIIRGELDPFLLTQVGPQFDRVCAMLGPLCEIVAGPSLSQILALLPGLAGLL